MNAPTRTTIDDHGRRTAALTVLIGALLALSYSGGHLETVSTPTRSLLAAVAVGGVLAAVEPVVESVPLVEIGFLAAFVLLIVTLPLETAMEVSVAFCSGGLAVGVGRLGRRRYSPSQRL